MQRIGRCILTRQVITEFEPVTVLTSVVIGQETNRDRVTNAQDAQFCAGAHTIALFSILVAQNASTLN